MIIRTLVNQYIILMCVVYDENMPISNLHTKFVNQNYQDNRLMYSAYVEIQCFYSKSCVIVTRRKF